MGWIARSMRNPNARVTGAVYLLYFLTAIFSEFLRGRKMIGFADTTNILATVVYVALALLFYGLFRPVNRNLSLIAALFSLAGCTVTTLGVFPRTSLHFSPLVFFGPYCLLIGYLIFKSKFLTRVLGVLMMLAGIGWLAFLSHNIAHHFSVYIEVLGIVAEASLMLWLVAMGVNVQRWKEQASAG